jgi:hypothetical protein
MDQELFAGTKPDHSTLSVLSCLMFKMINKIVHANSGICLLRTLVLLKMLLSNNDNKGLNYLYSPPVSATRRQ